MAAAYAVIVLLILGLLFLFAAVKVAREYERGVVFRLGRLIGLKGPGVFLLIPFIDKAVKVDLRTITLNVPPQEVITKDNVTVKVNAVAYFRVIDAARAIVQVENYLVPPPRSPRPPCAACWARSTSTSSCRSATRSTSGSRRSSTSRPSPGASRSASSR